MIKINNDYYIDKIKSLKIELRLLFIPGFCATGIKPIPPVQKSYYEVIINDNYVVYTNENKNECEEFLDNFIKEHNLDEHN